MIANDNLDHAAGVDQAKGFQKRKPPAGRQSYEIWYDGMSPGLKLAVQLSVAIREVLSIGEQWKLTGAISAETKALLLDAIHFTKTNLDKCTHTRLDDEFKRLGISKKGYEILVTTLRAMCLGHEARPKRALHDFREEIEGYLPK